MSIVYVPSYFEFIKTNFEIFHHHYHWLKDNYNFPFDAFKDLKICLQRTSFNDLLFVLILVIVLALLRSLVTEYVFKPFSYRLSTRNQKKLSESGWKFIFYLATSLSCLYIFSQDTNYLHRTDLIWKNNSLDDNIPENIQILLLLEIGFYFYSMYTLFYQDEWRKDSRMLAIHHLATIFLLWTSIVLRTHRIGIVVLFLHDICDVFLEASKCLDLFKTFYKIIDYSVNMSFLLFLGSWLVCRLYWFPLKAMHSSAEALRQGQCNFPFSVVQYSMLWLLLIMNFYWFLLILMILFKMITEKKLEDNREY